MRLSAKIQAPLILSRVAVCSEKLGKRALIRFTDTRIRFISPSDSTLVDGKLKLFAEVLANIVLDEYTIESLQNNEITLDVPLDFLTRALKTAQLSTHVIMKLKRKEHQPLLVFSCVSLSRVGSEVFLEQQIPVRVLQSSENIEWRHPKMQGPEAIILLPALESIRSHVDRMKTISNRLIVAANMNGHLNFRVETETVQLTTYYKDLSHPENDFDIEIPNIIHGSDEYAETVVDIRQFLKFLHCQTVQPKSVIASIHGRNGLVIQASIGGKDILDDRDTGLLTYFIPGLLD